MAVTKDQNGYTTITTEPDGIYLTVFPPSGKGSKVSLEDIKKELLKNKVTPDNPVMLTQIVTQASGKPQKIVAQKISSIPGQDQVFVEISDDEMTAKLTIVPPQSDTGHFSTIDDVREALSRRSVVYGIDENRMTEAASKLSQMASSKNLSEPIEMEIAFGTPVTNGEDARVEYLFKKTEETEKQAPVLEESEDGRVDYRAVHKIDNILKGTLLARKIPPTKGVSGMTVTGKAIEAKDGKDIEVIPGKGVVVSPENKDEWIAENDGQLS